MIRNESQKNKFRKIENISKQYQTIKTEAKKTKNENAFKYNIDSCYV